MTKKSRRALQKPASSGTGTERRVGAQPVRISRPVRAPAAEAAAKQVNFDKEYHYVIEDLRRIAIYAGGLLVLLIVLAILLS